MKRGYSLIELLISLAVLILLLGAGTLSFRDFGRRQQVIAAGRQIKADLRLAQTESSSGKKPTGCTGTLQTYRFRRISNIQYVVEADCSGSPTPILVRSVTMPANTVMNAFSPNPPGGYIAFKAVSNGTNLTGNVTITAAATAGTTYTQAITINVAGDIQ